MFGDKKVKLKDTERSLISETVSIDGTINSSGAIDVAGLVKGPVYSKEIIVRDSKEGEEFNGLDNKKYKLNKGMCVIADKSSVLGLGGIIGGTKTSTEIETKNILLESAYFIPSSIRKTARDLSINTDAKYRFERGIDPHSVIEGLEVATELITRICGGQASKFVVSGKYSQKNKTIKLQIDKFESVIGISISRCISSYRCLTLYIDALSSFSRTNLDLHASESRCHDLIHRLAVASRSPYAPAT